MAIGAQINNGGTAQVNSSGTAACDLTVGYSATQSGTVSVNGGSLTVIPGGAGGTGLLSVTNGGTVTATSVQVFPSGTLTGNGTVSITASYGVTVDGTLEPSGTPPNATLSISGTGGLLLHSGAATVCNVVPSGADNVQVSAAAALDGRLSVTMTGTFTCATTRYTLLSAGGGLNNTFFRSQSITYPTDQGFTPKITYDYVGNNVYLDLVFNNGCH